MQIGEVSAKTGVNIETIRYYERIGILPAPARTAGGRRTYSEAHRQKLRFIRRSRDLGFGLDEVRALLGLGKGDNRNCGEVFLLSRTHLSDVRAKIADLKRMETVLAAMVASCAEGTVPACPIIEVLAAPDPGRAG